MMTDPLLLSNQDKPAGIGGSNQSVGGRCSGESKEDEPARCTRFSHP